MMPTSAGAPKNSGQRCPDSLDQLSAYLTSDVSSTTDVWGSELVMRCGEDLPDGSVFGVLSKGADGEKGTGDDITSWDLPSR